MKSLKKQKDGKESKHDYKIKCLDLSMIEAEEDISEIKKTISRMRSTLDAHINRQFTEIRVVEKNGEWGDYSGLFYVDDEDEKKVIVRKAKTHFRKYFEDGAHHSNKKLGLFLYTPRSGKHLIEELETEGDV
tara:strand:- start:107 stop:502 length:396 start_codon:yes stop_codon:yes gene_type:complete